MIVGVVKETFPGERRVAIVPAHLGALKALGATVLVEAGAGAESGFPDAAYAEKGAEIASGRADVFARSDLACMVRTSAANLRAGAGDVQRYRRGATIIGMSEPLSALDPVRAIAETGVRCFALELVPRITRAQAMDVLSSQATIAGYRAVVLAQSVLPKMFPMMMTAAGTVAAARVFIIGAGVAGLQAIASARRAGAVVQAFDVRPEVKEQIESLGARFVQIAVAAASGSGGYAREQTADERQRQQQLMADTIAASDVVITTAAVPGKKAPLLIPAAVVKRMAPGSVIVDIAAERGGNCELTRPDEVVHAGGVTILGPTNLPASIPSHASQMFSRNVVNFLALVVKDGALRVDHDDEVVTGTMLCEDGEIVHPRAREAYGLAPLERAVAAGAPAGAAGGRSA
jgi:NAD(P) transhydrogenase subunit alpha